MSDKIGIKINQACIYNYNSIVTETKGCNHQSPLGSEYRYCPSCGNELVIRKQAHNKTLKDNFKEFNNVLYYKSYPLVEDYTHVYIFMKYDQHNLDSIKAAITELEGIVSELNESNIQGIAGLVHPYWSD